ncbi:hypothetical protein V2G26_017300 [Clonostachys chloroleuca]
MDSSRLSSSELVLMHSEFQSLRTRFTNDDIDSWAILDLLNMVQSLFTHSESLEDELMSQYLALQNGKNKKNAEWTHIGTNVCPGKEKGKGHNHGQRRKELQGRRQAGEWVMSIGLTEQ